MKNSGKDMRGVKSQEQTSSQHYVNAGDSAHKEEVMKPGSKVYIYKGQHKGLTGSVTKMYTPQQAGLVTSEVDESRTEVTIELDINQSEVMVKMSRVVLDSKRKELIDKGVIREEHDVDMEGDNESNLSKARYGKWGNVF